MYRLSGLLVILFFIPSSLAVLNVTVLNRSESNLIPLLINVQGNGSHLGVLQKVVTKDLLLSGYFSAKKSQITLKPDSLDYQALRAKKNDFVVDIASGKIDQGGLDVVLVRVYDVLRKTILLSYQWRFRDDSLNRLGHRISDVLYKNLLGRPGFFDTQISYVLNHTNQGMFSLEIADIDGNNSQTLLQSQQPILATAWSDDGKRLAYVTYYKNHLAVYVRHVWKKRKLLRFIAEDGMIFSPAFSPSGDMLAVTVSKKGNKDIYLIDLVSNNMKRLTQHEKIDTEPTFSPDGRFVYFSSNRLGGVQIYRYELSTGSIKPITKKGNYNAHPSISPDGQYMAMIHRKEGVDQLAIQHLENPDQFFIITHSKNVESPVFSPTGDHVIYSQKDRKNSTLIVATTDGHYFWRLKSAAKNLIEPAWSPILNF